MIYNKRAIYNQARIYSAPIPFASLFTSAVPKAHTLSRGGAGRLGLVPVRNLRLPPSQSESASSILLRASRYMALRRHTVRSPARSPPASPPPPPSLLRRHTMSLTISSVSRKYAPSLHVHSRQASSDPSRLPFQPLRADIERTTFATCRRAIVTASAALVSSGASARIASSLAISSEYKSGENTSQLGVRSTSFVSTVSAHVTLLLLLLCWPGLFVAPIDSSGDVTAEGIAAAVGPPPRTTPRFPSFIATRKLDFSVNDSSGRSTALLALLSAGPRGDSGSDDIGMGRKERSCCWASRGSAAERSRDSGHAKAADRAITSPPRPVAGASHARGGLYASESAANGDPRRRFRTTWPFPRERASAAVVVDTPLWRAESAANGSRLSIEVPYDRCRRDIVVS